MKLATITNWAYGATVALTLTAGASMLLASQAHEAERAAVEQRYLLDQATSKLRDEVYKMSGQARQFVVDEDPAHLIVYRREAAELASVEERIAHIGDAGASPDELDALAEGIRWADTLHDEQLAAIAATQRGDDATARRILFGAEYERELDRVDSAIERFQYRLDQRTGQQVEQATRLSVLWQRVSEAVLIATGLLFLCVLYFIIKRRILNPVVRLSDVVTRLAAQDYAVDPPDYDQVDEIGDMAQALRVFQENGLERQRLERERDEEMRIRDLMSRMMQRMQNCESLDELGDVVVRFVPEITSGRAGRLYLHDKRRNAMNQLCDWLSPALPDAEFSPLACWALRRGAMHRFANKLGEMPCQHFGAFPDELHHTVCLPLTAQQETIGLLTIETLKGDLTEPGEIPDAYLEMLAENISLAVANLRLRGELSDLAMQDPLTGLPNRRNLEKTLARYADAPDGSPRLISCLVMDIDHFKQFNDRFGHDAGDEVLRRVADTLKSSVRDEAMAFRYGGEEFVVLIPGLDGDKAIDRAEYIRTSIASLDLYHDGRPLGRLSASFGVACAPQVTSIDKLVQCADGALLRAKEDGRDRVVAAVCRDGTRTAA